MIMTIAIGNIFFILCDIWLTVEIYFEKILSPPEKISTEKRGGQCVTVFPEEKLNLILGMAHVGLVFAEWKEQFLKVLPILFRATTFKTLSW